MSLFNQAYCLVCHEPLRPLIGWKSLFSEEREQHLCLVCDQKLVRLEGEKCRICCRSFQYLDDKYRRDDLCHDCVRWEEDNEWQGYLDKNHSLYLYNDFLKETMARFKFRGDYVLIKVFAEQIKQLAAKINPTSHVPIPLSDVRLYERGFNQAEALISEVFKKDYLLSRLHSEKQSKKSRTERIHLPQVFQLEIIHNLKGAKILLYDDVYTTGSTLRHAAKLLKEAGAASVESITIAR
ncbi:amidophosphoribosyltransferase [Bacillus sp. MRMR6]|nr:ComF family protein [Bacillus sp. MRMR6]OLS37834.1 amidophosphoribosyltransferase [Bacillus sp. MRMR6]